MIPSTRVLEDDVRIVEEIGQNLEDRQIISILK
jgi:hypothetical protein